MRVLTVHEPFTLPARKGTAAKAVTRGDMIREPDDIAAVHAHGHGHRCVAADVPDEFFPTDAPASPRAATKGRKPASGRA